MSNDQTSDPSTVDRGPERDAAITANATLDFAQDDKSANERYLAWRSVDPYPEVESALLNSADVADYVARTGMIYPFNPGKLKSASYEVPLCGPYMYVDENGKKKSGVLKVGQEITVRKNSITFLTVEPFFRLPDYIALRHNLKIDHIYKGLLVGTGPLIDPGFVGRISLPLHNLTENDYTLVGGEGVIWVEFTKLSSLPSVQRMNAPAVVPSTTSPPPQATAQPNGSGSQLGAFDLPVRQGAYVPFDAAKTQDRLVQGYVRKGVGSGDWPESSTAGIARDARKAKKVAQRLSVLIPSIGAFSVVALIFTLYGAVFIPRLNAFQGDLDNNQQDISQLESQVRRLEELTQNQSAELRELRRELRRVHGGQSSVAP